MTEVEKSLNHQNPAFMLDLFIRKEVTYDLRVKDLSQLPTARTVLGPVYMRKNTSPARPGAERRGRFQSLFI